MTRDTVEEPGEGSSIEAKEEAMTKGEIEVDILKKSQVTRTEMRSLYLANRRTHLRERSQGEYFQSSDGARSQITKGE